MNKMQPGRNATLYHECIWNSPRKEPSANEILHSRQFAEVAENGSANCLAISYGNQEHSRKPREWLPAFAGANSS